MFHSFQRNIDKQNLFSPDDKILATVSGGVDSVVLCYLLKELNANFEIAHCNFQLRGEDSEKDELFVKELAKQLDVICHCKTFDTKQYSTANGISTQMAARDLRYSWFDELKEVNNINFILTAHHKNDNVETVLLNLVRGTSHKGLSGISSKKNELIRPLLPFTKEEIIKYANDNFVQWREDVSNESNKYKRNLIRNKVIPLLEELNPNFVNTFTENMEKFSQENLILNSHFTIFNSPVLIKDVVNTASPLLSIWNWIEQYGFSFSDAKDILASLDGVSGKQFLSETHRIVKDRDELVLSEIDNSLEFEELVINEIGTYNFGSWKLEFGRVKEADFSLGENVAFLNVDKLKFPLTIRKWREGDKFQPLGMKGMKKVSDYLIDNKLAHHEKEKQLVLISNNKIAWLVGRRIDERFKVLKEAENSTRIKVISNNK